MSGFAGLPIQCLPQHTGISHATAALAEDQIDFHTQAGFGLRNAHMVPRSLQGAQMALLVDFDLSKKQKKKKVKLALR